MPGLKKAKYQAARVVCMNNVKQQMLIFFLYASDNNGKFPTHDCRYPWRVRDTDWASDFCPWQAYRKSYMENSQILICPAIRKFGSTFASTSCNGTVDWQGRCAGGWDGLYPDKSKPVSSIGIAYSWYANYTPTHGNHYKNPKLVKVTYYNNEPNWPKKMQQCSQRHTLVTHIIVDNTGYGLYDYSHGGAGAFEGWKFDKSKDIDNPVGCGDGHVYFRPKSKILLRASYTNGWGFSRLYY